MQLDLLRNLVPAIGVSVSNIVRNGDATSISLPQFADNEVLTPQITGSVSTFTLANAPNPAGSLRLVYNGSEQDPGQLTSVSGTSVTIKFTPQLGDTLVAHYRY